MPATLCTELGELPREEETRVLACPVEDGLQVKAVSLFPHGPIPVPILLLARPSRPVGQMDFEFVLVLLMVNVLPILPPKPHFAWQLLSSLSLRRSSSLRRTLYSRKIVIN
jgi:hypothetical protein